MSFCSRREWLTQSAMAVGGYALAAPRFGLAAEPPATRVAVAKCADYGPELLPTLDRMFDQLGGLGRLVKGKTVAIKVNLTGSPTYRLGYLPAEDTHYTHPRVMGATAHLLAKAGARRIRFLESPWSTAEPIEEYIIQAGWDPNVILNAAPNVEFENTNYLGKGRKYSRFVTPNGGYIYKGFDLNHSFEDCDVFMSLAKMKEHATAGVTLSMKNCFGNAPATIYGSGAGEDEPSVLPKGGRQMFHSGYRTPSKSAPPENGETGPKQGGWRVPRIVVDINSARPFDFAVVEGIRSMAGGEGPWIRRSRPIRPGVLVAGTNGVNIDAVCLALMGFDPMAERGTPPFERCDSTLQLGEAIGIGTRDLKRIEVVGTPIQNAVCRYRQA